MKILILALLLSTQAFALDPEFQCGHYEFQGTTRILKYEPHLMINENSASEFRINLSLKDQAKAAPYVDLSTKGTIKIKKLQGPRMVVAEIQDLYYGNPDPANPMKNSYLRLVTAEKCE